MISLAEVERIRNSDLPASARHILYELSIRANKEGFAYPSIKRLAHDTGYSENHIRKRLSQLESAAWIAITRQPRKANLYEIRPIAEGPGKPFSNPAPRDIHTAPRAVSNPAPRDVHTARGEAEVLHETEGPIHEDHEETKKGIDEIRRAWRDRNPPYFELDVTQAQRLIDRYTAAEIIAAIKSWKHPNDLNPFLIAGRIEILRDFPEFSHQKSPKKSQKRAKKEPKKSQKTPENPLKN